MRRANALAAIGTCIALAVGNPTTSADAAVTNVDGFFYELPVGADKNIEAVRVLIEASDALGMTRRGGTCPGNANCLGVTTASHEYRGSGTWNGIKSDAISVEFDYR